jgi:hypothetical protein
LRKRLVQLVVCALNRPTWSPIKGSFARVSTIRSAIVDRQRFFGIPATANFIGADLRGANLIGATLQQARLDRSDLSRARLSGANLVSASFENACLAKAEMEFALMAKAVLRGACLCEADMSGAQLDRAVLRGPTYARPTCEEPGFARCCSTRPTSERRDWVAHSSLGPRYEQPICAAVICVWQGSTAVICLMPTWRT